MKNIFGFFLLCLIFTSFPYVNEKFLKTDIFTVEEIYLEGDVGVISKELEKVENLLTGNYIWDVDTLKLEEILEEDIRIEKAMVSKEIPNKLRIEIKSKKPEYYVLYNKKMYSLDEEKKIFSYLEEFSRRDYPILSVKTLEEIEELMIVLERLKGKQFFSFVSQLYVEDKNCIKIILLDGTEVKTKTDIPEEKYNLLARLYSRLKNEEESLEYIDIRFGDYIVK